MLELLVVGGPIALAAAVFTSAVVTPPFDLVLSQITIPAHLEERGYEERAVSNLVRDELNRIRGIGATHRQVVAFDVGVEEFTLFKNLADVLEFSKQVHAAQITLGLVPQFADLSFYESKDSKDIVLQVRIHDDEKRDLHILRAFEGQAANPDKLVRFGAEALVEHLDPYLFASYLFNSESVSGSEVIVPRGSSSYDRTRDFLEKRIRLGLDNLLPWYENLLGIVHTRRGQLDDALGAFERALQADKNFDYARINWGYALSELGDQASAIAQFRKVAATAPEIPITYLYWSQALVRANNPKDALKMLDKVHQLAPDLAHAYALRAQIAERYTARTDLAEKYWEMQALLIEKHPRQVFYLAM